MSDPAISRSIEAIWRIESTRLIAGLARFTEGDLDRAEDLAQEALITALEEWPRSGVPENPGGWLMRTAGNRAIDLRRRERNLGRKYEQLGRESPRSTESVEATVERAELEFIEDDVLRLIFITCHPILSREARVALTLRLVAGLTTEEIARAFLTPRSTIAQRLTRAKRSLREARVPFELPGRSELHGRLRSVLEVVYLTFNEGYSASAGEDWVRPALCEEAMRLGRILAALTPEQPEVHGLLALMELQASRIPARSGPDGEAVLLLEQDRASWDQLLIRRGLDALDRSEALGVPYGPYTLQAAIAACHARARVASDTDWERIVALYDALRQVTPSPVIDLNRAMAVAMAFGPEEALDQVDLIAEAGHLTGYHLLHAVRGDLLFKLGRFAEAKGEFLRAAEMAGNEAERRVMRQRAEDCT